MSDYLSPPPQPLFAGDGISYSINERSKSATAANVMATQPGGALASVSESIQAGVMALMPGVDKEMMDETISALASNLSPADIKKAQTHLRSMLGKDDSDDDVSDSSGDRPVADEEEPKP